MDSEGERRAGQSRSRFVRLIGLGLVAALLVGAGSLTWSQESHSAPDEKPQFVKLEEFPKGWVFYAAENGAKLSDSWRIQKAEGDDGPILICLGKPFGYIRTVDAYENFEFGLEWRYPSDENGNSGILVHTTEADKVWPKSFQIQLHNPKAGSIFPSGGAKSDNTVDVKDLSRPVNEWNTCVIVCREGTISVMINDKKAGEVTGCMPQRGTISLQCEGSEIHFRKLWLKKLPKPSAVSE